ncbi:Hypothetical predicted protein [Marmota monax]|uniref:Uncharacterized protein n=1 Tax=Marmota monax TaxID=9995 RepID=A0A5E4APL5_MARMO|nr:hypothetical protein GHT09_011003 [Marmota monax]VTJ59423.1 Hypothetical predicted protein [Marmota monax]
MAETVSVLSPCLSFTQLDKLRTIIESMLASSSTLLSMSMTPHKPLTYFTPGRIDPNATCPACSLDLGHQVSTLVRRYEQLQDIVSNLAASRPSKKAKLQSQVSLCLPPSQCPGGPAECQLTALPKKGSFRLEIIFSQILQNSLILPQGHSVSSCESALGTGD